LQTAPGARPGAEKKRSKKGAVEVQNNKQMKNETCKSLTRNKGRNEQISTVAIELKKLGQVRSARQTIKRRRSKWEWDGLTTWSERCDGKMTKGGLGRDGGKSNSVGWGKRASIVAAVSEGRHQGWKKGFRDPEGGGVEPLPRDVFVFLGFFVFFCCSLGSPPIHTPPAKTHPNRHPPSPPPTHQPTKTPLPTNQTPTTPPPPTPHPHPNPPPNLCFFLFCVCVFFFFFGVVKQKRWCP